MADKTYYDYFRYESGDPVELTKALAHELEKLAAAGVEPEAVEYKPDLHYVEVPYEITLDQARALGYDEAEIARLVEEAG